ncbi:MAG: minor capsid protein [Candidatus Ornithomonoglobus sp.]
MKNEKYWLRAAEQREREAYTEAEKYLEQMLEMYDRAEKDIQGEIKKIKYNFAKRYGIDDETADFYLSSELRSYDMEKLTQTLLDAETEQERKAILDFIHRDGLSKRAYASRTERYKEVLNNIELRMITLEMDLRKAGTAIRETAYKNNFYRVVDDTAKGINAGISFSIIDEAALDEVMSKPWHGKRFSKRIWDNTARLAGEVQEITGRYIVTGRSLDKAAAELAEAFEVEKFHATTLIHTETAHARALSDAKAYEDIGIEEYRYMATLDEVTCEVCGHLDGQIFKVSERQEGVNFPVMHPRCRCTTTMAMRFGSGRRARNPLTGGNKVIDDMSYDEWRRNMTEEEKQAFEAARRGYKNKSA